MARFDVYQNKGPLAASTPYLVDVQAELLDALDSRVVIPLRHLKQFPKVKLPERLAPVFRIEGRDFVLETPKLAAVPRRALGNPITSLLYERERITASLDFLMQGF